jgi:hypothetical protein
LEIDPMPTIHGRCKSGKSGLGEKPSLTQAARITVPCQKMTVDDPYFSGGIPLIAIIRNLAPLWRTFAAS